MHGSGNENDEVSTTSDDEQPTEVQGTDASRAQIFVLSFCSTSES